MRDGLNDPRHFQEVLAPAEGLDAASTLFTSPPIESLELLKELGEIARLSLEQTENFLGTAPADPEPATELAAETTPAAPAAATAKAPAKAPPKTGDAQLLDALLEYHRLRGPTLGARTAPKPSGNGFARADASSIPGERFSPVDIPVVNDFEPKTSTSPFHSKQPIHSILQPKKRP